jgi:DNA-binding LacI/PurR family transcriptional regulator
MGYTRHLTGRGRQVSSRATQADVARLAGVNRATVSYVLSGRRRGGRISEAVTLRVREAARALGYLPNRQAQALVSGRTRAVGLLVQGLADDSLWVWSRIAEGAEDALLKAGHDVLLRRADFDTPFVSQAECLVRQGRVDGVVALVWARLDAVDGATGVPGFPLVSIDLGTGQPCPYVGQDPAPGLVAAVDHLRAEGHWRLLWVGPRMTPGAAGADRLEAVRIAARARGMSLETAVLPIDVETVCGAYDRNMPAVVAGIRAALPPRPTATAILCWCDFIALGLCTVLRERGLRIPGDVSVVGFDDVGPHMHLPALSTVSGAFSQMGAAAAALVLRIARGEMGPREARATAVAVPTFFVRRASSGPAPETSRPLPEGGAVR